MIWDREAETMSRTEMDRLQAARLVDTVRRVYERVPFYRRQLDEAGVRPADIRGLEDLRRLPFTRKQDLRDNYPWGLFAVPQQEVVRIHASSGTKGKPTVVGYTRSDLEVWSDVCARSLCLAGGRQGDIFHNAYGYGLFTGGLGLHYGAERLGASVIPVSGGNTPRQVLLLQDFQPRGLGCTPSYALNIADAMEDQGIDPRTCSVEYGVFGAEPWSESMRQKLEERLNLNAIDIYGLSEVIGPGVSGECWEAKTGLHIQEDHFLPEVVDPATGEPVPDGQYGELVLTTLTKVAQPAIRYRTGDIAALYRDPCRCGRTTARMSRVKGRSDDMLVVRGVNLFPSEIEYVLLQMAELAPHYQLEVDRSRAMDSVGIRVEPSEAIVRAWGGFDASRPEAVSLQGRAAARLSDALGLSVGVTLLPRGCVPRSEGKAVRVVDRRSL